MAAKGYTHHYTDEWGAPIEEAHALESGSYIKHCHRQGAPKYMELYRGGEPAQMEYSMAPDEDAEMLVERYRELKCPVVFTEITQQDGQYRVEEGYRYEDGILKGLCRTAWRQDKMICSHEMDLATSAALYTEKYHYDDTNDIDWVFQYDESGRLQLAHHLAAEDGTEASYPAKNMLSPTPPAGWDWQHNEYYRHALPIVPAK